MLDRCFKETVTVQTRSLMQRVSDISLESHVNFYFLKLLSYKQNLQGNQAPCLVPLFINYLCFTTKNITFSFTFEGNQSLENPNDRFIKAMADLVLDKEVLVLISSIAKERIYLARAITFRICENTKGTNMRMVQRVRDLRCLEKEKRAIVTFIHDTFNPEEPTKISAVHDTFEIIRNAMKTNDNEVRALFSLSREEYDNFN